MRDRDAGLQTRDRRIVRAAWAMDAKTGSNLCTDRRLGLVQDTARQISCAAGKTLPVGSAGLAALTVSDLKGWRRRGGTAEFREETSGTRRMMVPGAKMSVSMRHCKNLVRCNKHVSMIET